jgi:hypothetical protein
MKAKIIISLVGLLVISGAFLGGCDEEEPKPDYITVNITIQGWLNQADSLNAPSVTWECSEVCKNHQVKIKMQKDQGETFEEIKVTNAQCSFSSTASFKLYRQQPIEMWASSKNDIPGYSEYGAYKRITWDEVYPVYDFGDTYNHYQPMELFLVAE